MVRHNEHFIKFLQLNDLLHVLQITFADIRPEKSIKKDKKCDDQAYKSFFTT